jgi:4,4'-diaponeurosporenoate glycosyltransferase
LSAVANVVALMGSGACTGPPRRSPTVAFGPCLAISRADYDRAGGHADLSVRSRVTEDIGLAGRVIDSGAPVRVAAGRDLVRFRMYPSGPRQLADGWTKMLAAGAAATPIPLAAAVGVWITGGLLASRRGLRWARRPQRARDGVWYVAWAAEMGWLMRRAGRFGPATAAAFPVPLLAFVALFARSALAAALRRPVRWRGRRVAVRSRAVPAARRRAPA